MKLIMTAIIFFLAYKYLDKNSTLRKVLLIWTGIVLAINCLSLVFSVLGVVVYVCIVIAIVMFLAGLVKKILF